VEDFLVVAEEAVASEGLAVVDLAVVEAEEVGKSTLKKMYNKNARLACKSGVLHTSICKTENKYQAYKQK
jgi:hypothetical protein